MDIRIRPAAQADKGAWAVFFEQYAACGNQIQTPEMRDRVWQWIHSETAQTVCLLAEDEQGQLVGFVHFRSYERPLPATTGTYIDDMFVSPQVRGAGIVDQMIDAVGTYARHKGWDVVRWMTAETNYRARSVYDRHADKTKWITYELRS